MAQDTGYHSFELAIATSKKFNVNNSSYRKLIKTEDLVLDRKVIDRVAIYLNLIGMIAGKNFFDI